MSASTESLTRVLFVCGRNEARSQMAEGLLRHVAGSNVLAASAGVSSGTLQPMTVEVMREAGIDISMHVSKAVSELVGQSFDLVVTLCDPAREYCLSASRAGSGPDDGADLSGKSAIFTGMPVMLHWSVDDPVGVGASPGKALEAFREARDRIREHVRSLVEMGFLSGLVAVRKRWEGLIDTIDEGIIAHDSQRRIFLFNRAAERIMGVRREEVIGRDCHSVFGPDGMCGSNCSFCTVGEDAEPPEETLDYEMDMTTAEGLDKRLKMSVSPLELVQGRPWGVIAALRDMTEVSELRQRLAVENGYLGMVGVSPPMREIFETIRQISTSDYPVLITGESGTGKELVASAIHQASRRSAGPFVPINCGALPDGILESELFGHVRGAFTGAIRDKKGRFELAHHGTIFLDEVGELSPSFQVKLLRILQEKRFEMVGGERTIEVDVRVISATNRDLRAMIKEAGFREDLFYRLCVVPLQIPPLRKRLEDVPLLVEHTLGRIREETGAKARSLSDEAMALVLGHTWPGNVRELINALQYATVQCSGRQIQPSHLPLEIRVGTCLPVRADATAPVRPRKGRKRKLDRVSVERALSQAGGNKVRAAKILEVGRATLYRFLGEK
ncbi:MAG: sigma 54-interacting transcriptional regulator [Deltaproteobacteria bacterium]|nr:sigma 54-interacting transcriptional regulator [Deltaproteobacteria bacterium]